MSPFLDYPDPIPTGAAQLDDLSDALGYRFLDGHPQPFAPPAAPLAAAERLEWVRIEGSGRLRGDAPRSVPTALLGALAPERGAMAILGRLHGTELTMAFGRTPGAVEARALSAVLQGRAASALPAALRATERWSWGCLFGWPGRAHPDKPTAIDLFVDAFWGQEVGWLVYATPEEPARVEGVLRRLQRAAEEVDRVHVRAGHQQEVDRRAMAVRAQLDSAIKRYRRGRADGMWRTSLLLGARDPAVVGQGLGILASAWRASTEEDGVRLRAFLCGADARGWSVHANTLLVEDIETVAALPTRDMAGFQVTDVTRFDVDHRVESGIVLGGILDGERDVGRSFAVPTAHLCRHALVAGQTGSGKSTTVRALLAGAARAGIPFLVLDPVKPARAEYAALASLVPGLRILTMGAMPGPDEIPLLLNPLSFPRGFPLFTHLDLLKATFTAAFGLFPPLPYLLEAALHRAYAGRGWNLSTGEHARPDDILAMPTLSDLLAEVDGVFAAAGYASEVTANLRSALRTRLGGLCTGPRGLSLDTRDNLPDALLFGSPVVIELLHVGSPEEQAFVMGLLLTRLYEVRQAGGLPATDALRHLVVVEEAHRLLKEAPRRSGEDASPAAQAVETIGNLLAEVRAYGQGIVVAEQLPSTLARNVVKQSSLKILHRLTPRDDREAMGDAMVLTPEQKRAVATLPTGRAAIYGEGMDGAVLVQIARVRGAGPVAWPARGRLPPTLDALVERRRARARMGAALRAEEVVQAVETAWVGAAQGGPALFEPARAAIRRALRAVGSPSADASVEEVLREALEDALLARALHYRATDAAWTRARSRLARLDLLAPWLATHTFRREGHRWWCDRCPAACRFGHEGLRIGADAGFQADIDAVLSLGPAARPAGIDDALTLSRDQHYPGLASLEPGLRYCAVAHALAALPLPRGEAERTLRMVR